MISVEVGLRNTAGVPIQSKVTKLIDYYKKAGVKRTVSYLLSYFEGVSVLNKYSEDLDAFLPDDKEFQRKRNVRRLWWNLKAIATHKEPELPPKKDKDRVSVAFAIFGGLGELIINMNYVYHFTKSFGKKVDCTVIGTFSDELVKSISASKDWDEFPKIESVSYEKYFRDFDLIIRLIRFPTVIKSDSDKIESVSPELLRYIDMCRRFYSDNLEIFEKHPLHDYRSNDVSLKEGRRRIQQPDIYGYLEVGMEFGYSVDLDDEDGTLNKLGIKGPFITINRDAGMSERSTKLWPEQYYDDVTARLKASYPDYTLVQVGGASNNQHTIESIDMDLVGKTNMEELKILLKRAELHICSEGGTAHLRHMVRGGPSVVLFGPTDPSFYGYDENENLYLGICEGGCEWKTKTWNEICNLGFEKPPCLWNITPEIVMERIRDKGLL